MKQHRYAFILDGYGDWVVLESYSNGEWSEHTRWLVPGSELEGD